MSQNDNENKQKNVRINMFGFRSQNYRSCLKDAILIYVVKGQKQNERRDRLQKMGDIIGTNRSCVRPASEKCE